MPIAQSTAQHTPETSRQLIQAPQTAHQEHLHVRRPVLYDHERRDCGSLLPTAAHPPAKSSLGTHSTTPSAALQHPITSPRPRRPWRLSHFAHTAEANDGDGDATPPTATPSAKTCSGCRRMRYIREEQSGGGYRPEGRRYCVLDACLSIDPLAELGGVSVCVCVYVYVCRVRYAVSSVETRIRAAAQHGMHQRLWWQRGASTRHASAQQPEASAGHRDAHFDKAPSKSLMPRPSSSPTVSVLSSLHSTNDTQPVGLQLLITRILYWKHWSWRPQL